MRALLRRLAWRLDAWLPAKDSGQVERSWAMMRQASGVVEQHFEDPVHNSRQLLALFSRTAGTSHVGPTNSEMPIEARLELVAEHWERALIVNSVLGPIEKLRDQLVDFARELALQVLIPQQARMSAADIGARHVRAYRTTMQSFRLVVEIVTSFLHDLGTGGAQDGGTRWQRVVAEFVSGFVEASQIRALEDQEEVFAAIALVQQKKHEGLRAISAARFHDSPVSMALVTRQGRILETNGAFQFLLGRSEGELAGRALVDFVHSSEDQQIVTSICDALPDVRAAGRSTDFRLDTGHSEMPVWVRLHWAPSTRNSSQVHIVLYDTTSYHLLQDWRLIRTQYDEVTNLPTRARLQARLAELLTVSDKPPVIGIYGIRLYGLADITATLGLGTGDEVLRTLAVRIARIALTTADLIAHLDRDTIAVLVKDPASWAAAGEMVRQLVEWLSTPVRTFDDYEVSIRPIVGVVQGQAGTASSHRLLRQLELSLRADTLSSHRPIDAAHSERDTRRNRELSRLSAALEQGELTLVYAPIARTRTGKIAGFHATIQWEDASNWETPADELIELADSIGLSLALGPWIVREAARQAAAWAKKYGARAPFVRVDIPDRLAADESLVQHVGDALAETGLSPDQLHLVVTEAGLLDAHGEPRPHLFRLQASRIPLTLTGFGVNVRRFDLLSQVMLHGVVIAVELVEADDEEVPAQGRRPVLPGLVDLVQRLDLSVTMPKIDRPSRYELAERLNTDFMTGGMIGPAQPANVAEALIARSTDSSRTSS